VVSANECPPDLCRRLTLEAAVRLPDGAGGFSETWEPLGHIWAELRAGSGREVAMQAGSKSRIAHRIFVRSARVGAPSRPVPGQRFRDGARVFEIAAVTERDPSGRYLVCYSHEEAGL
jgi:head-tail adaptor